MVLDCELLLDSQEIIVFDLYEHEGSILRSDYMTRIDTLTKVVLPVLPGFTVRVKDFYPPGVVSQRWYDELETTGTDGLIIHEGASRLGVRSPMYKWKSHHTVDLMVSPRATLVDASRIEFMKLCIDHGKTLRYLDIWECTFDLNGRDVRPIKRRADKKRANATHVCHEIRAAHLAAMTVTDVSVLLASNTHPQLVKKRKR